MNDQVKAALAAWKLEISPEALGRLDAFAAALKEAGSEPACRRTGTGYEAIPSRASGQVTAKLLRPRDGGVTPAVGRGRSAFFPGELSPHA